MTMITHLIFKENEMYELKIGFILNLIDTMNWYVETYKDGKFLGYLSYGNDLDLTPSIISEESATDEDATWFQSKGSALHAINQFKSFIVGMF